ncbi:MAG: glycogen debranching protein GlgX [Spirochaetales bacterium]
MIQTEPGSPYVLGATPGDRGCNFALFSKNATAVELLLFPKAESSLPSERLIFDSVVNKTGDIWHMFVPTVAPGQLYGYSLEGPWEPLTSGHRFNAEKLLLDPYGKAVVGGHDWNRPEAYAYDWNDPRGDLSLSRVNNFAAAAKSAVVSSDAFDWERDKPLNIPLKDAVIYETHVRSLTRDASAGCQAPGSYLALREKIPYLKDLGINCVELMPIHEFNPSENTKTNPETGEPLVNFWGYSTMNFFSPASWYASDGDGRTAVSEFKALVKDFHESGIEVILDVVYNHTAEGNEYGPTFCFRGLDNSIYYMLEDNRFYKNYSGCGNTLNCNHPVVRRLILDSLRYWVVDMHVDGFRFDLAAILGRGEEGEWIPNYSVLNDIANDPILSNSKIIAEGWDAAGLFKVGAFPRGWAEWNSHYRDDMRSLVKSDFGVVPRAATRLSGSSDLFHVASRRPWHSINFITAHDGFTLADLVSYSSKHNWANAEHNQDGNSHNLSWNCGVEGLSRDPGIQETRRRQRRNLMTLLLVSQGTPMLQGGDELGATKFGNNNTYCHDNRLNWMDWSLLETQPEFHAFTRFLIHFRKNHPALRREAFFQGGSDIEWRNPAGASPDWNDAGLCLSALLHGRREATLATHDDNNLFLALNFHWEARSFVLPVPAQGRRWTEVVNTATEPGFSAPESGPTVSGSVRLDGRSIVVLVEA